MTYPPHQPDDDRPGLGEPVTDAPLMRPPATPGAAQDGPGWPVPPPMPPPGPKPSRAPWAWVAALGAVATVALVVGLFAIKGGRPIDPDERGGDLAAPECVPSTADPGRRLTAEEFYEDETWTNSLDSQDTAEALGVWDHTDCCDVGLSSSQEKLNDAGCLYGIESAFESSDGHLGIGQLILVFDNSEGARHAAQIDFTSFRLQPDSGFYDDSAEVYGYMESSGSYLVVTIGAIDTANQNIVDEEVQTLGGFHYDHLYTLPWK